MTFHPQTLYSFANAKDVYWQQTLLESELQNFEVPGEFFESDDFASFFYKVFQKGKNIVSIKDILPTTLSRNLASVSEGIKKDVHGILCERIEIAGRFNVKYINIDLGLDSIRNGYEIQEISVRAQLIQSLMPIAEKAGVTLCQSIRFPATFPGSQEWKFANMLICSVMHSCFRTEINAFPTEINNRKVQGLLKRNYYNSSLIRFIYEPYMGSRLNNNIHNFWSDSLAEQGFSGDLVFAPHTQGGDMLNEEIEHIKQAMSIYAESE